MSMKHTALTMMLILMLGGTAMAEPPLGPDTTSEALFPTNSRIFSMISDQKTTFESISTTKSASASTTVALGANLHSYTASGTSLRRVPDAGASTGTDYTTHSVSVQEQMMMNFINRDRAANGLHPLALDPELSRIARIKSQDMRDNDYFAHESPTWGYARDMLRTFGYDFRGAGENIAHHATVEKAQAAFLSSPGHRRNIMSAVWEKVGIGIVADRNGYMLVTQIFAR